MKANADSQPYNEEDDDFGLVPEKPIFTLALDSIDGEEDYLGKLYTESGEKIEYTRRGSTCAEGINGMIDIYDTFLPSGQPYKTIYINMYGAKNSDTTPNGFKLIHEKNTSSFEKVKSKDEKANKPKEFINKKFWISVIWIEIVILIMVICLSALIKV
jgi:hypothetical protein